MNHDDWVGPCTCPAPNPTCPRAENCYEAWLARREERIAGTRQQSTAACWATRWPWACKCSKPWACKCSKAKGHEAGHICPDCGSEWGQDND